MLFFALVIIGACSTTKNTFVTRTYHNINSRYNGYFYARESLKEAQEKIAKSYVDDYSQLLPVFRLPTTPETKGSYADLEKAIKKATTCIERHAITLKSGAEVAGAVRWIDDCYLVIAQAHYYKGEYITAIEIFDYMIQKYSSYPIKTEALLWKARAQIALGAFTDAESLLDVVSNDKTITKKVQAETKATYADLYMQTGNYANAIKNLEDAIALTTNKKTIARYTFILAQLYEKVGNEKEAFVNFGKVVDMHPEYNMFFNAKLSRARLSAASEKNRNLAKKDLQKMLADPKNTEFKDQIYYTLAQLDERSKNKTGALTYYRQSVAASVGNNKQKALSFLALGDIYFADTDYKTAQAYYDSTMQVIPKDYPGYKAISEKHKSLANLVRYINIVSTEDSLQNVATKYGSDTTQLYAYVDKLIVKAQLEEKRKKELQEQQLANANPGGNSPSLNTGGGASAFYFYNNSNVSFGINEFTRKWGNRTNEDNWRRANKEALIPNQNDNPEDVDTSSTVGTKPKAGSAKAAREPYIKNLPLTAEAKVKSDERIADALYNLGSLYKEQMNNTKKAAEAFETLTKRFPNHKYALASHFQLWRLYKSTNEIAKSEEHKNYICNNFPQSEYCSMINNPDYYAGKENERTKINEYYAATYEAYTKKDYVTVIARSNYADTAFDKKNEHAAQFAYLRAVSLGKTQGNAAMEPELTRIVANYPKDPMRQQAQALLDALHKVKPAAPDTSNKISGPAYSQNENVEYQFMVVVDNGKGDLNKFKIGISDYNSESFASSGLTINSMMLDNLHTLVLVKSFGNQKAAMNYYTLLKTKGEIFANLSPGTFQVMVISTENFSLFFKDKNVDTYKSFFEKNIKK
ncbi:MAG: tetratricopeptide repeat protein [Bacteroidota bacterium]|nr:tetratricopeptide repeat protein [Bacteroidota bacterium]